MCENIFVIARTDYKRFCGLEPEVRKNRDLSLKNQDNLKVLDGRIESLDKKFELLKTQFEFMEEKLDDNSKAIKDLAYTVEKIWDMLNRK
jgi:hypothetical protein